MTLPGAQEDASAVLAECRAAGLVAFHVDLMEAVQPGGSVAVEFVC